MYTEFHKTDTPTNTDNLVNSQRILKKYFTCALSDKFDIKLLLKITPHPKRVATLPCEIYIFFKLLEPKHSNGKLSAHEVKKM